MQLVEVKRMDSCDGKLHMSDVDTGCDDLDPLIVPVADEEDFFWESQVDLRKRTRKILWKPSASP